MTLPLFTPPHSRLPCSLPAGRTGGLGTKTTSQGMSCWDWVVLVGDTEVRWILWVA